MPGRMGSGPAGAIRQCPRENPSFGCNYCSLRDDSGGRRRLRFAGLCRKTRIAPIGTMGRDAMLDTAAFDTTQARRMMVDGQVRTSDVTEP